MTTSTVTVKTAVDDFRLCPARILLSPGRSRTWSKEFPDECEEVPSLPLGFQFINVLTVKSFSHKNVQAKYIYNVL